MKKSIITLTDNAVIRIKDLMDQSADGVIGLRIKITSTGCSGHKYDYQYVTEENKNDKDEIISDKGVTVFVDSMAVMYMLGAEMDYIEDKMQSGFSFSNPNVEAACGCGESFSFKTPKNKM